MHGQCLYGPINSYYSFWWSNLILWGYNVDTLNICMKEFIIFVCTDSTEIFLTKLRSSCSNYNLPSFFTDLLCGGYLISIAYWLFSLESAQWVDMPLFHGRLPGCVAQPVTCLATDACLTADPGVASSIPVRSHTFVEIDHEIISTVILLPSADLFKKGCCQLQAKVCARITG